MISTFETTPAAVVALLPVTALAQKNAFLADALFDFEKAVWNPEGKGKKGEALAACYPPDRRSDIEVTGARYVHDSKQILALAGFSIYVLCGHNTACEILV